VSSPYIPSSNKQFSIKVLKQNKIISDLIYNTLKQKTNKYRCVVVSSADNNFCNVSIAIDEKHSEFAQEILARIIAKIICSCYKRDFLDKSLNLPSQDSINLTAFKDALVNFDKETDYFIISKNLILDGELYLESFYNFKLSRLQDKWGELVKLANENRDYLVCKDAFFDLLKFLIDNIDVSKREVEVFEEENGYRIIPITETDLGGYENQLFTSETLVSSLIELSPRKIEFYYSNENDATHLVKTIYEKRVNLHSTVVNDNLQYMR
jgi:hypothetical protein